MQNEAEEEAIEKKKFTYFTFTPLMLIQNSLILFLMLWRSSLWASEQAFKNIEAGWGALILEQRQARVLLL